ncbi:hypothetical protein YPPY94_2640, partial [Yersinia pestis PY-94]
MFCGGGAPPP